MGMAKGTGRYGHAQTAGTLVDLRGRGRLGLIYIIYLLEVYVRGIRKSRKTS